MQKSFHCRLLSMTAWIACVVFLSGQLSSCQPDSPAQPEPQPVPDSTVLKIHKITAGPENSHAYTYNKQGLLTGFDSYWVYNDSVTITSRASIELEYDSLKRIHRMSSDGKTYVKFFYEGKLLDYSEEYDHRGRLVVTHFYLLNNEGKLVELLDKIQDPLKDFPDYYLKAQYEYDQRGNVRHIHSTIKRTAESKFEPWRDVYYEDYDDKKNPECPQVHYPFLPQSATMTNNPGKITVIDPNGTIPFKEVCTYTYNAQGYPIQKSRQVTTTKQLPVSTFYYQY